MYLERGRTNHLSSGTPKSHERLVAACWLLLILFRLKMETSPALPNEVQAYVQLRQQIHDALRVQHPEWIQPGGESPICDSYEARLMELLASD